LTHAIRRIKRVENNKPIRVIQDELGYALGRDGGSAVEYWRKGNLPPGRQDVEELARLLVRRGRLDQVWLSEFLESGGCGLSVATLAAQLFGDSVGMVAGQPPDEEILAPSSAATPPFQTPGVTTHFVGRELELTRIQQLLTAAEQPRVVALVGMGGAGKTTLAAQAAHQLRGHYGDGVLWAHTQVSSPLDILNSWARAFGYDYSGLRDVESCAAALRSALAAQQVLFVLDDVTSAAQVRALFVGGQAAAILLTTRSEDVAAALNSQILHLAELAPAEGVQLLVSLLGDARVAAEEAAAAQICERVHHLPLAVEIAGQLLVARPRRSLAQMAKRLQDVQYRLDLQISDRDVRTSFLVSWEALDATHRRVFAHLALFGGRSCTAVAVADILVEDEEDVIDQLDLLVARSLLTAVADDSYRQHPLLADFAQEQLGDAPEPWRRFTQGQLDFARRHQTDYAALEPEWENLMAGMATAHRLQAWPLVLDYAAVLTEPWFTRARYTQARQGYAWAVEAVAQTEATVTAHYLVKWSYACAQQNDYAEAMTHLEQAIQLGKQRSEDGIVADAQHHLARIAVEHNQYERADELLTDCLALRVRLDDQVGIAKTMYQRAILFFRLGDYEQCSHLGQQALAIQKKAEKTLDILETLRLLTECALACQDHAQAASLAQRAMTLSQRSAYQTEFAEACFSLAVVHRRLNDLLTAWRYAEQSRQLFEQMGIRSFLSYALYEESKIKLLQQEYAQALALGQQSLAIMAALSDDFNRVYCLKHLGQIYQQVGNLTAAETVWCEAEQVAIAIHHPITSQFPQMIAALTEGAVR
ncbi:MAG: NB-ARC domain-containing protein, partial [Caldilineaceae bacterium]